MKLTMHIRAIDTTGVAQANAQDQAEADREFGRQCAEDVRRHRAGDEPPAWVEQEWKALTIYAIVEIAVGLAVYLWCKKEGWL
jgi:hypothetical protein